MQFKEWILSENFDSISDFLLNPEHRHKQFYELEQEFVADGGKILGYGKYAVVFTHPKWKYVVKLYSDRHFTSFARFAYRNPHPAFPVFYGPPQKILPYYSRSKSDTFKYLVRTELLYPINKELFEIIEYYYIKGIAYINAVKNGTADHEMPKTIYSKGVKPYMGKVRYFQDIEDILKQYPKLYKLFEGIEILQKSGISGQLDFHAKNFMQRRDGQIVFSDPLWEGVEFNPYQAAKMALDMETDRYGDADYANFKPEKLVVGGKFPKRERKPKSKPNIFPIQQNKSQDNDEIPF